MLRDNLNDLLAFVTVARERSFTRAAARLGVSQSALSHAMRGLESRLGISLLSRTTRSVSPTEAGERLLSSIAPLLEQMEGEIASLNALRDKPSGTIRITTSDHPARTILLPVLEKLLPLYPDIKVEIVIDHGLTNIVAERYDAGIRLGEQVEKDMIAVQIGPDIRIVVVGSPQYIAGREEPQTPRDLTAHNCINLRLPTYGGLYAWEFEKGGQALNVRVDGQITSNLADQALAAAIAGLGLAFVPEGMALPHIQSGALVVLLEDWCPYFPGYHLYFPSRRQQSPAFTLLVDALRYRSG